MKKENQRLYKVIENDRLLISEETSSLISYDLKTLLNNYFNVEGKVHLSVLADKNSYKINVVCSASDIKSFKIVK